MPLPDLPTQHKAKEADFGVEFRRWWEKHRIDAIWELKHTRGKDYLPFGALEPEQITFLLSAESRNGVLTRVTVGTTGTSDYIGLIRKPAFVVIRYTKYFYIISIDSFLFERDRSSRKSLTEDRAQAIATYSTAPAKP